ncbi:MAG: hypothetical protein NVS4B11_26120 [Ktedonobacteraceae bacterium]
MYYTILAEQHIWEDLSGGAFAFLRLAGGTSIVLWDIATLPPGITGSPGGVALGLEVEDVDAVWNEWKAKGVEVVSEIADMGAGRSFRAKDPEGHRLSVSQMYKEVQDTRKRYGLV